MTLARWTGALAILSVSGRLTLAGPAAQLQTGSPTTPLPSAAEVVARHVTAIGGAAALKATASVQIRGKFEAEAQSPKQIGDLETFAARPGQSVTRVKFTGMAPIENGYDGKTAWTIEPEAGPRVLSGAYRLQAIDDAHFDATLHEASFVKQMTTIEKTTFARHPAIKMHVVFVSGRERDEFYDAVDGWYLGWEARRETPYGTVPASMVFSDYKKFGGLMQATTIVQRAMGRGAIMRLESFEYNRVPPGAFDLPQAIKALIR